ARAATVFTDATTIDPNYFTDCRWLHLSGYSFLSYQQHEAILKALSLAENSRYTRVSLDPGTDPIIKAKNDILEVLPRIDVIFPNETELALFGSGRSENETIDYLLQAGVKAVVNKRGKNGSLLGIGNKRVKLPAFNLKTRDTTGAGDSFNAGVVLGRLVGLTWEASVALGNALGGLATTHEGAGATLVDRHVVAKLVEEHLFNAEWEHSQLALEELATYFEGPL
ncbi:MAG: carbohydrate kinase family protein, partial [Okeania sp. SIO3B3]|nr:carbohydrate kinase family protein [Okeania sp. SIO3B3]